MSKENTPEPNDMLFQLWKRATDDEKWGLVLHLRMELIDQTKRGHSPYIHGMASLAQITDENAMVALIRGPVK